MKNSTTPITRVLAASIAAAGRHPFLISAPAGSGVLLRARGIVDDMPQLSRKAYAALAFAYGTAGLAHPADAPPFRAPHYSVSAEGLFGGQTRAAGEVHLAHGGMLYFDDADQFNCGDRVIDDCADYARQLPSDFFLCAHTTLGIGLVEGFSRYHIVHEGAELPGLDDREILLSFTSLVELNRRAVFSHVAKARASGDCTRAGKSIRSLFREAPLARTRNDRCATVTETITDMLRALDHISPTGTLFELGIRAQHAFASRLAHQLVPVPF